MKETRLSGVKKVRIPRRESFEGVALAWSATESHLALALVSLSSALGNIGLPLESLKVVLLADQISEETSNLLHAELLRKHGISLDLIELGNCQIPTPQGYYSAVAYYRLFLPYIFPNASKIIYFDSDTFVIGDLYPLLSGRTGNFGIAACTEPTMEKYWKHDYSVPAWLESSGTKQYFSDELQIHPSNYLNSGVLLYEPKEFDVMRFTMKVVKQLETKRFWFADQCLLASILEGKFLRLDPKWNHQVGTNWPREPEGSAALLHFSGWFRPWKMILSSKLRFYSLEVSEAKRSLRLDSPSFDTLPKRIFTSLLVLAFRLLPMKIRSYLRRNLNNLR